MTDEKEKLEAIRNSLEIIKKFSTDPEESNLIDKLTKSNDEANVDDELMMKLIHSTYAGYDKQKESNSKS